MKATVKDVNQRNWSKVSNNEIAYDFVKSKGFKNVFEAICCMGREEYHREFREFKTLQNNKK